MNYIDIIILTIFAWVAYRGFVKGLILSLASFAAIFIGIWGAVKFSSWATDFVAQKFDFTYKYTNILAFIFIFIVLVIVVFLLAKLLEKAFELTPVGIFNKIGGLVFAIAKYLIIISVVLVVLDKINNRLSFMPAEHREKSLFYSPIAKIAPMIFPYLHFEIKKYQQEKQNNNTKEV